jgi:hypothetical protein
MKMTPMPSLQRGDNAYDGVAMVVINAVVVIIINPFKTQNLRSASLS